MQLPVVGVKALQPRGLSANIQDRGQAKEPECRRLGPPWWTQSCWCRSPGSLRQDDGRRAECLCSASSNSPLGQETQAQVAHAHNRIFLLATIPLGSVERGPRRRPSSPSATSIVVSLYSRRVVGSLAFWNYGANLEGHWWHRSCQWPLAASFAGHSLQVSGG